MFRRVHVTPFAAPAPSEAFVRLAARRGVFWLDSSQPREEDGRFSVIGCEPRWVFAARDGAWRWLRHAGSDTLLEAGASGALDRLEALLDAHRAEPGAEFAELPFLGGAVGWLSYDLGRQFEAIGNDAEDDLQLPDIRLAWHDAVILWDHQTGASWLVAIDGERTAQAASAELAAWLSEPAQLDPARRAAKPGGHRARSNLSQAEYEQRVGLVREGIARGEFYQLNLVQRFEVEHRESAAATYLRLRAENPAPFSAFLATDECAVLCSSPERFLEVSPRGAIRTCPIKGTRPRGKSPAEDAALQTELLGSAKERAELLMIVDLLRNDLGRVCVPGSVEVTRLHALESFATVHHLVGEVRGQLRPGLTRAELLRAVFPGGSITGAPKVSAMRAIERLEPHRRGIAMGAIGYFSAHGRIDLNIAIRTIVCRDQRAFVSVGAGVVWDSDPAAEYAETLAKARALFAALGVTEVAT